MGDVYRRYSRAALSGEMPTPEELEADRGPRRGPGRGPGSFGSAGAYSSGGGGGPSRVGGPYGTERGDRGGFERRGPGGPGGNGGNGGNHGGGNRGGGGDRW